MFQILYYSVLFAHQIIGGKLNLRSVLCKNSGLLLCYTIIQVVDSIGILLDPPYMYFIISQDPFTDDVFIFELMLFIKKT